MTREVFGYSFATWRFHLRGETIRSAADVGWMRDLTVGKMMRHDVRTVPPTTTVAAFREAFRSAHRLTSSPSTSKTAMSAWWRWRMRTPRKSRPDQSIKELLRYTDGMLVPGMAIKEAVLAFDRAEAEALAVVNSYPDRRVIGLLTEAYALRRYAAELERRRQEMVGDE